MLVINIVFTAAAAAGCIFAVIRRKETDRGRIFSSVYDILQMRGFIVLMALFALGVFVRVYKLDVLPIGLHFDETGAVYDAYSLANYGVDRYLNPYPVYLLNYGSGQSAMYSYVVMLSFKIFGYSIWAFRVPMALLNATSILTGYALIKEMLGKRSAVFGAFLITICPYFMMSARFGLDCYLMMPAFTLALWLFVKAVKTAKARWFIFCGAAFGITLYSYALSYVILPVFLVLSVVYLFVVKSITVKNLVAMAVPLFLFALPLLLMIMVNLGMIDEIRTSFITIPKLMGYRGGEISMSNIGASLEYIADVFTTDEGSFGSSDNFYVIYMMSLPFTALGLWISVREAIRSIKEKRVELRALMVFVFVAVMACMMLLARPTIYKANAVYIALIIFTIIGISRVCRSIKPAAFATALMYFACFTAMCINYFAVDTVDTHAGFYDNTMEAYSIAREMYPDRVIYLHMGGGATGYEWSYTYALLADLESPYNFFDTMYRYGDTTNYGNNRFYLPLYLNEDGEPFYEIYPDSVYLIRYSASSETHQYLAAEFERRGFSYRVYEDYRIYYYD
jgi:4-amino-4-deoxy-L-arabinose transferase and related glycosyltransferases of PMT family